LACYGKLTQDEYVERAKSELHIPMGRLRRAIDTFKPGRRAPGFKDSDIGDAFIKKQDGNLRFAAGNGDVWREYQTTGPDYGTWTDKDENAVRHDVRDEVLAIADLAGINPTSTRINSCTDNAKLSALIDPSVWRLSDSLFPLANGVYDLELNMFSPHRRENYITAKTDWEYDPDADCPTFRYVLSGLPAGIPEFFAEYVGYCLTDSTRHEVIVWLYGPKGSGKSTIIETIRHMFGPFAMNLGLRDLETSRFALGSLPGKRLLYGSEQPGIYVQDASSVFNSLVSGEPVKIERKFSHPTECVSTAKFLWGSNELPRISDPSNGFFRRIKIVKFPALPAEKRDPKVKEAALKEIPGVFNWAVEGLKRLNARGYFDFPESVRVESADFELINDLASLFVQDRCVTGPDKRVRAGMLYENYVNWCAINGHKPSSSTRLAQDWQRLGFSKVQKTFGAEYIGIGLKTE
jgi:putative DNA primase/helicase